MSVLTRVRLDKLEDFDPESARRSKQLVEVRLTVFDAPPKEITLKVRINRRYRHRRYWAGKSEGGITFRIRPTDGWNCWQRMVEFDCTPEQLYAEPNEARLHRLFGDAEEIRAQSVRNAAMFAGPKVGSKTRH